MIILKLGLIGFAERRRSSAVFLNDMRKLSISNGDGINTRSPGGVGKIFFLYINIMCIIALKKSIKKKL